MYLNVFRSRKRADMDAAAYAADAARMEALAAQQPGYIAYRFYLSEDGEGLSLSEWDSEAHARAWAAHAEHVLVQARGRTAYYDSYTVYSCNQPQVRAFSRQETAR